MVKVLLLAAIAVIAATEATTLFERFQRFESVQEECRSELDNAKQKLDLCGFVLLANSLNISDNNEALDEYIFNSLALDSSTLYELNGTTTHIQSFNSSKLHQAIKTPTHIVQATSAYEVRANFLAGSSQFEGEWTHLPFLYEQKVLRKSGLSFYNMGSAVRHDLIVPWLALRQLEHGADAPVAICVASHYIAGVTKQECELLMDVKSKQACVLVANGQCPTWAVLRPQAMQHGTGILIDSRTLRQLRGSDFDPRKIRVFLQAVYHDVAGWFKEKEEDDKALLPTCDVEANLWFGNVNVHGARVELYRGNYELVCELPAGSNVSIKTIPGIYTLRADGKVKKSWQVASHAVQAVFYAKLEEEE